MLDFNAWLGAGAGSPTESAGARAALAWRRINDKPTSVVFRPPSGADLAAQTVRLEYDEGAQKAQSDAGDAPIRRLIVFGIQDHDTLPDTVMVEGYRFTFGNDEYRIIDVIQTIGELQAIAETSG